MRSHKVLKGGTADVAVHVGQEKYGIAGRAVMCNKIAQIIKEGLVRMAITRELSEESTVLGMDTAYARSLISAGAVGKDDSGGIYQSGRVKSRIPSGPDWWDHEHPPRCGLLHGQPQSKTCLQIDADQNSRAGYAL